MHDSHAHIISGDQNRFPSPRAEDPVIAEKLADPFTAARLLKAMNAAGIEKALVVQRGQIYGHDNSYVIAAAAKSGGRLKAVCSIDAANPAGGNHVRELQGQGAAGFRLMAPIGNQDFQWLEGAQSGFWNAAVEAALPVCVHFFGWNRDEGLRRLMQLLDHYPVTDLVIDHLTNGAIVDESNCGIDDLLRQLSAYPNVSLKFTAIPLNDLAQRNIDAGAVLSAYLALFGPDRLLWGSDVTQSSGSYLELAERGRAAVASLPSEAQEQLLGRNVKRIYRL